jgi:hypothetical protein
VGKEFGSASLMHARNTMSVAVSSRFMFGFL